MQSLSRRIFFERARIARGDPMGQAATPESGARDLCALRRSDQVLAVAFSVKTKVLQVAARKLGGPGKLRDRLRMPSARVLSWLAGVEEPPQEIFLSALEVILDDLEARSRPIRKKR